MTQINGSISFDTEKIGREVSEALHDSFAALHASLAAVSERLQRPAPLTREAAAEALTGPLGSLDRATALAGLLHANGFALVKLPATPATPASAPERALTQEERARRWFSDNRE